MTYIEEHPCNSPFLDGSNSVSRTNDDEVTVVEEVCERFDTATDDPQIRLTYVLEFSCTEAEVQSKTGKGKAPKFDVAKSRSSISRGALREINIDRLEQNCQILRDFKRGEDLPHMVTLVPYQLNSEQIV